VRDIDTVVVDSLKALDPKRPIREADVTQTSLVRRDRPMLPKRFLRTFPSNIDSMGAERAILIQTLFVAILLLRAIRMLRTFSTASTLAT
jgi:hypothetical protein